MGLLSIFERGNRAASTSGTDGADPVQVARVRARHRLIGAAVLVIAGVIGFPLVFETQPRPIPVDIPIEIPKRDAAPALTMPAPKPVTTAAAKAPAQVAPASAAVAAPRDDIVTETKADAGRDVTPPITPAAVAATPAKAASTVPADTPKKPAETRATIAAADAARAKALLDARDTKPTTAAKVVDPKEGGRFVVQVGAFADAGAARDMRAKAEKLGLKTYTQVVDTASGSRTRVRIGPFASREEADKAVARAKEAGLNAVVLTL